MEPFGTLQASQYVYADFLDLLYVDICWTIQPPFLELPLYRPFFGTHASTNCLVLQLLLILPALLTVLLLGRVLRLRTELSVRD